MLEGKKEPVPDFRFKFHTLIRCFYPFFDLKSENRFLLSFSGMVMTAELSVAALGKGACTRPSFEFSQVNLWTASSVWQQQ